MIGLTRDVNSDKAKSLLSSGAELRTCDLNKPSEVETALKVNKLKNDIFYLKI